MGASATGFGSSASSEAGVLHVSYLAGGGQEKGSGVRATCKRARRSRRTAQHGGCTERIPGTTGVPPAWHHGDQVARLFKEYLGLRLRFLPGNGRLPGIGVLMLGIVQCGRDARGPRGQDFQLALRCRSSD